MIDDLTFAELRLASKLHKPHTAAMAMTQLTELAKTLVPGNMIERFMDGEPIDAYTRLLRRQGSGPLLTQTLAEIVIQIDRFAALNDIDLAAAIRQQLDPHKPAA